MAPMTSRQIILIIASLLLLAVGYFVYTLFAAPSYTNLPPASRGDWLALGDSLTSGVGASEGRDYPSVLGSRLGVKILNYGTPGHTTADGLGRLGEITRLNPRVVLLCLGGNDGLRSVPLDETMANLGSIIDRLHSTGAFVVLIGVRSATMFDKNEKAFAGLAREKQILYVPNILKGVFSDPRLMSDTIHPNDEGYAYIANRLEAALLPILTKLKSP